MIGGFDSQSYWYSTMCWVAQEVTGASEYWNNRITARGVDVALLDSGVVEVEGLKGSNSARSGC
jgi:hypothetical protein